MESRRKLGNLLGSCSLLLLLASGCQQANGSQYAMTSQYLGAQSQGNEHVLLFKLPKSISSHIQQEQGEESRQRSARQAERSQPIYRLSQPDTPEEQSISLTIPLSTLRQEQPQTEVVYKSSQVAAPKYVVTSAGPLQLVEPAQPEYVVDRPEEPAARGGEQLEQKQQQLQHLQSLVSALSQQLARQEQEQQLQDEQVRHQRQQAGNSSRAGQEQHQQQLLDEQYATTQVPATTEQPQVVQLVEQPQVWRDNQREQDERGHRVEPNSGLLTRLASSSPELRQRLRSLLGRMSRQQQLLQAANSTGGHLSARPIDNLSTDASGELDGLERAREYGPGSNYSSSAYPRLQQLTGPNHLLNTFLTSHNLSSHEEIKIPLVVIAMPRILSLKRNQLSSSSPNLTGSAVEPAQPSVIDYAHTLLRGAAGKGSALLQSGNRTNWSQQSAGPDQHLHQVQQPSNYTGELLQLHHNHSSPYLYLSAGQPQQQQQQQQQQLEQPSGDTYQDRLQLVPTTTSIPHTMAPYARHFSSLGQQQAAELAYRQPYPQTKPAQSQQNQTLALNQFSAQQHRHLSRTSAETVLLARPASNHRAASGAEQRGQQHEGGVSIQLLSSGPREFVGAGQQVKRQPYKQQQQQLAAGETWDESRLYRSANPLQVVESRTPLMMHPLYSQQAELARAGNMPMALEESLGRIRPLLQVASGNQYAFPEQHGFQQPSPLSRAQLGGEASYPVAGRVFNLMGRARQTLSMVGRQSDLATAGSQPASSTLTLDGKQVEGQVAGSQKAAQMVLMIV